MTKVKKIVHVVIDDKFIDGAIKKFESVRPGIHQYFLVNATEPYHYIKDKRIKNLTLEQFKEGVRQSNVASIIFHSMPTEHYGLLDLVPDGKKVFWLGWGFDYYNLLKPAYPNGFVQPRTAKINAPGLTKRMYHYGKSSAKNIITALGSRRKTAESMPLARVDYFSPVLDSEFYLVCQCNSWFQAEYINWNYGTVEDDLLLPSASLNSLGNNILVGNSATATSNHYEAFQLVKSQMKLAERKVVVPLSYGDPEYRKKIIRYGREIFGDHFSPLVDFQPPNKYTETLNSCGFVMMNHIRQQALGNICISALLGSRIFLNAQSPLTIWLKEKGLIIGDIKHIDDEPLKKMDQVRNAEAIRAHWGGETQHLRTQNLVEVALS